MADGSDLLQSSSGAVSRGRGFGARDSASGLIYPTYRGGGDMNQTDGGAFDLCGCVPAARRTRDSGPGPQSAAGSIRLPF
jgi:hypothetical protein